jgi:Fur family ferric uptake transcriptional regulator
LRVTKPRLLVLGLLHATPGHHSADDIVALLAARGTPLPRASVYNVVSALVDCGLITMVSVGPGSARYEYGIPWHHHFVCKACGSIQDVRCVVGEKPCLDASDIGGHIEEAQITFRGTCNACQSPTIT